VISMRKSNSSVKYTAGEEERILDALGRGLLWEFPNPSRTGCPPVEVLRSIASHNMPLTEAEKWLDHLCSCSPCYGDFCKFRLPIEPSDAVSP
jgi:hypothetical protein